MNPIILWLSTLLGLLPFNRHKNDSFMVFDYALMLLIAGFYLTCYGLVNFSTYGVYQLKDCDSICRLGNILFMHLGCVLFVSIFILSLLRGKQFFVKFKQSLEEIDFTIEKCRETSTEKVRVEKRSYAYIVTWIFVLALFAYALYYDIYNMFIHMHLYFFVSVMITTFPFVAGSIVQGQFIYFVGVIMGRFNSINNLLEAINQECDRRNIPLTVFDIETNSLGKDEKNASGQKAPQSIIDEKLQKDKRHDNDDSDDSDNDIYDDDDDVDDDDDDIDGETRVPTNPADGPTSEGNLPELFKLHDKILTLSVLTNAEFGAQCVPYMTVCFVIGIFGIFLETKVIFIVGGKHALLDYVAQIYVIWSLLMMVVAYLVLRLCCNSNGKSKNSAMIVHEIMQKKPAFMLGNDLYYNKMKSFTLQFLHWEGFFQFNGIGLFALDYTFIFSTVSAATSYLIVLLQFDMSAILKNEGLA